MSVVRVAAPLALVQHGVVHRNQVRSLGVSDAALKRAVAAGELIRRAPEVFAIAGVPTSWKQCLMVAVLDAGPGAAVSHRAAAILLGIARRGAPFVIEISVPRPRSSRLHGVIVHRSGDLDDDHIVIVDGLPCTGPLRTLVDLGAVERWPIVADAFERALQSGQVTQLGGEWMLTRLSRRGRAGCGVFRRVIDERALKTVSPEPGLLEPRMARLLRDSGLPLPEYQYEVRASGVLVARLDFAYPSWMEAFEVDGFETHGTPDAMTRDFEREHRLRALGWNITRFTWVHVVRRSAYVLATMSSILGAHMGA
jgi:hypothetical protein